MFTDPITSFDVARQRGAELAAAATRHRAVFASGRGGRKGVDVNDAQLATIVTLPLRRTSPRDARVA